MKISESAQLRADLRRARSRVLRHTAAAKLAQARADRAAAEVSELERRLAGLDKGES